jgi:hypothetical protein
VRIELLALLLALLLRVVEPGEGEALASPDSLEVDADAGGDQRAREGTTAGLVDPGDEAVAERAIEAEEASGGAALSPARLPRRSRPDRAASRWRRLFR